jgi:glycosyltransferase involved in cell wall biosynthesis
VEKDHAGIEMKMNRTTPFLSVVVITYNGAATLARTLDSLLAQTYAANNYEIIVIDDGSTDATPTIAATYPVRYVRQDNGGHSCARNAGIPVARGDVYVTFDDDCIAYPDLLSQLASGYDLGNPAGVGGYITEPKPLQGLVAKYINATGHGTTQSFTATHGLWARFCNYIRTKLPSNAPMPERIAVGELYGANGSYPLDVLKEVNGWDIQMSGIEDRDLSYRIKARFPDRPLIAITKAKLIHDPKLTISKYLLRPWKRGPVNLRFHSVNNIKPPIFPFPILTLASLFVLGLVDLRLLPAGIIVMPLGLYFWWPYRMVRERQPVYILFAYVQLSEELMVIAGLMRGYVKLRREKVHAKTA